jgi:hypothetical protein
MQKLTLDVDELCVESFGTARIPGVRGTVEANAATKRPPCELTSYTCACAVEDC